jgi:hypothetical protein
MDILTPLRPMTGTRSNDHLTNGYSPKADRGVGIAVHPSLSGEPRRQ